MRRNATAVLMVAALGGCMSFQNGPETGGGNSVPHWGRTYGPPTVPGVKGPYGESVPMAAPYSSAPPPNAYMARSMMSQSLPLSSVQMNNPAAAMGGMPPGAMVPPTPVPPGGILSPPGMPFAPGAPGGQNVPGGPSSFPGMPPGGMPPGGMGPGGMRPGGMPPGMPPGPMSRGLPPGMPPSGMLPAGGVLPANMPTGGGVINANIPPGAMPPGGVMQTQMAQANPASALRFQGQRTQIRFVRPAGMRVSWFTQGPDGKPMFSTTPIEAPGRYNFPQAAIYRLKLSNMEGRPGLEIYPTMEVVPSNPKTEAFLAHSSVPIDFTNEDFKQIAEGNYLVKVIYLPDPQFQDVAGTGTDEILSTRLEPGADPIQEALRRGSILVVLRMGNVDQEAPNTPPLNAPAPNANQPLMLPPGNGMMPPPNVQVPFWGMKPGMPMMAPGAPMGPAGPLGPMPGFGAQPAPGMNAPGLAPNNFMPPNGPLGGGPTPGPLNVPSVPMPGNGQQVPAAPVAPPVSTGPRQQPSALEVSAPRGTPPAAPGTSSTSNFQVIPGTSSGSPAADTPLPPVPPQSTAPAFPPTPAAAPVPTGGPAMPGVSMNRGTGVPTAAQLASETGR